jgi:hypothetical protein
MRYILLFWALPMGFFWAWFGLSYYDINFGLLFFSRGVHDFAFEFYGNLLGIDPATIPPLVARACVVDTALIFGIYAFRKRREIAAWFSIADPAAGRVPPAE